MEFRQVAPLEVDSVWHLVEPGIQNILRKCPDRFTAADVKRVLRIGNATLFLIDEGKGFFVVEILTDPFLGDRILNVWLLWFIGGRKRQEEFRVRMKQLGRDAKCTHMQFRSPRKGWEDVGGFTLKFITWECPIEH